MATAESNRAIPAYQAGPFDQLGRGQRMMEDPSPSALPRAHPASNGRRPPGRFTIQKSRERSSRSPGHLSVPPFAFGATPARLSGSLSTRKTENSNPRPFRTPTGFQPAPVARQVHLPRRAEKSNPTVLPAHPLAAEPGYLAGSLSVAPLGFEPRSHRVWEDPARPTLEQRLLRSDLECGVFHVSHTCMY